MEKTREFLGRASDSAGREESQEAVMDKGRR